MTLRALDKRFDYQLLADVFEGGCRHFQFVDAKWTVKLVTIKMRDITISNR